MLCKSRIEVERRCYEALRRFKCERIKLQKSFIKQLRLKRASTFHRVFKLWRKRLNKARLRRLLEVKEKPRMLIKVECVKKPGLFSKVT